MATVIKSKRKSCLLNLLRYFMILKSYISQKLTILKLLYLASKFMENVILDTTE